MSSPRRIALLAAWLALAGAGALGGQTPDERARLERLARRYDDLLARENRDGVAGAAQVDSVQVGGVWIVSDSLESAVFRGALEPFRRVLEERLGIAPLPLLDGARIVVRFGRTHPGWGRLLTGDTQLIAVQERRRTAAWLAGQLTHAVDALLAHRGGASLAGWHADVRLFQDPTPLREAAHLELLTASVPGAQGCYDGRLDACARSLSLSPAEPLPSGEATAELRRFIAERHGERAGGTAPAPAYLACVERGDGTACLEFLERAGLPLPTLSSRARGTVLATVWDVAGSDGLARFFADTGVALVPRLERASGMPLDSLIARWRDTILAHRPAPTSVPGAMQWLVIAWAGVFVALATRSTRWR